MTVKYFF